MKVLSVNLGTSAPLALGQTTVQSAIAKRPSAAAVKVGKMGLEGDEQADPSVHGGLSKAIYAYPVEHYAFWQTVRAQARVAGWGEPMPFGTPGENLTLEGLLEDRMWVGDYLVFPDCVLAVSEPRFPCEKLNAAMGFRHASRLMFQSGYCGGYLGVIEPGSIAAGQAFELHPGPRDVNLRDLFRARAG